MRLLFSFVVAIFCFEVSAKTLVIVGDSITEGYGVAKENAFPALLEKKIKEKNLDWKVVNSGVSGSTSASGPQRVAWQMKSNPDILVIALGANDGLRGFKVQDIRKNLDESIAAAKKGKTVVILAGMQMPPNYGKDYTKEFKDLFPDVAKKNNVKLFPFLLDGVAGEKTLNQPDGIHPNEKGHVIIADKMMKFLEGML